MTTHDLSLEFPGAHLDVGRMPGHWLLARMGMRVLRPGGLELTHKMLEGLAIGSGDDVVEFAPGLGIPTRLVLARSPTSVVAIERDETAARATRRVLRPDRSTVHSCGPALARLSRKYTITRPFGDQSGPSSR